MEKLLSSLSMTAPKKKAKPSAGVERLAAAHELDKAGSSKDALDAYEDALALLLAELKSEKDSKRQSQLRATIEANMSRAEVLKKQVRQPAAKKKVPQRPEPTKRPAKRPQQQRTRVHPPDHHDYRKAPVPKRSPYEAQMLEEMLEASPGVTWSDVAGLETAKRTLQEAVVLPYVRPDLYRGLRAPPKGVLLYGPPGTGKTLLAKAVASESALTFFSVSASSLTSKWVGDGEKLVRALFDVAAKEAPSCIFLDELDSLLAKRGASSEHEASRRLKNEFLVRLDTSSTGEQEAPRVLFIGATNLPWALDEAVLRRLPRRILIPLPDPKARRDAIDLLLDDPRAGVKHRLSAKDKDALAKATASFSMSELRTLAQEASYGPLRDLGDRVRSASSADVRPVALADFHAALKHVKPSCDADLLRKFDQWTAQFGVRGGA
mmetsp:Transcript_20011/g.61914  ORF Transcript_20011/g.61914 Transcript_20011/m.61914 type:complete len:435 (+) Transcript_20011:207-1511(+)